jgi:hypothetical protein
MSDTSITWPGDVPAIELYLAAARSMLDGVRRNGAGISGRLRPRPGQHSEPVFDERRIGAAKSGTPWWLAKSSARSDSCVYFCSQSFDDFHRYPGE